ncbi:hypothetical protein GCM10023185_17290 [Hymenobacter saemangeumensis]|uniref:Uncharacterized protein n=1 Tax=Hymenobacter saemangeumensis TaxID=1084522 RepID=A0ABP8IB08_9BACT
MDEVLKSFEKTVNTKHSVGFTPKYSEKFRTSVNSTVFIAITEKTLEKLNWDLVYKDDSNVEAKRKVKSLGFEQYTEAITISYEAGEVTVKSESLGNEMWDLGRNSKRVKLFIYAFEETLKAFDGASLKELEEETEKKNKWNDYVIPEALPQPVATKAPNFIIVIAGGLAVALILGFVLAFISIKGVYIIGLFEFLVALVIAYALKHLIKLSNFTDFSKLQYLLLAIVILTYLSNQYFQYEILTGLHNLDRIGFGEFMKMRLSAGLTINKLNTGWIGLLISWVVQIGLTLLIAYPRVASAFTSYLIERVPLEVVDFAFYHLVKEKSEEEVRAELSRKGWSDVKNQDEVFEAIVGLQNAVELNRIK